MIRSNQRFLNVLNIVSDGVFVFISFVMAYLLRFDLLEGDVNTLPFIFYFGFACVASVLQVLVYGCCNLYQSQRKERLRYLLFRILFCHCIGYSILLMGLFWIKQVHFSRLTLAMFFVLETFFVFTKRCILVHILYHFRSKGYNQKHILIVGSGCLVEEYLKEVNRSPELGYSISGYVAREKTSSDLEYYGTYQDLDDVLDFLTPDEVVVAMPSQDYPFMGDVIGACELTGTKLSIIPFYTQFFPGKPCVDFLHHIPMLLIRPVPLEHFGWAALKRFIDFFGSLFLILLLSPLLLATALGVATSSKGPIIFTQTRVGLNKKEFKMYKFRSMVVNNTEHSAWSKQTDSRKTKFGTFIRKCSIDELPQLFNVLKGDMSLIGPRPEIPHFVEQFKVDIPLYMVKHQVRPGMTGWAQVNGFRGDTSIDGRIKHDIYYIEHWSLWFDIKIVVMTLVKGIFNEEN